MELESQKAWKSEWNWTETIFFLADCIGNCLVSGPKMISQVKMCHLVNDLLQNVVARLVENASDDGLCFAVSILGAIHQE